MHWTFKIKMSAAGEAHLRHLLANPQSRATASRIINIESRKMMLEAGGIADEELRPNPRRNAKGYHRSFVTVPARSIGLDRLEGGWGNNHEAANWVEYGTKPHPIKINSKRALAFPLNGEAQGEFGFVNNIPEHPGTKAYRIAPRAFERYLQRYGNVLNR